MHRSLVLTTVIVLLYVAVVPVGLGEGPASAGLPDSDILAFTPGTSLPADAVGVSGDRVAYQLAEAEADSDLNGDGDQLDVVIQLLHVPTRTITNTGLAVSTLSYATFDFAGDTLVVLVDEEAQGNEDFNADGDLDDVGYFVYDAGTDDATNLGIGAGDLQGDEPYSWSGLSDGGRLMCIPVQEWSNGDTDLNGDGDTHDLIVHVWDASSGTLRNLGFHPRYAPAYCSVSDDLAVFDLVEAVEGDLNGDSDTDDRFAHVFTAATGSVTRLASSGWTDVAGTLVVQERPESGTDLNGDGDGTDSVAFVYDAGSGITHNTTLAGTPGVWGALVAIGVPETAQGGSDLNDDGDSTDLVLHLYNVTPKVVDNTQMVGEVIAAGDGFVVVAAPTGVFSIHALSVYDLSTRAVTDLAVTVELEFFTVAASGALVGIPVREAGADLNSDGDTVDVVAHVYDHQDGSIANLGHAMPVGWMGINSQLVAFGVDEAQDGGADVNGDGDATDVVVQLVDTSTGRSATTGYGTANDWFTPTMGNGFVAVVVNEAVDGDADHNGDGDAVDDVLFAFSLVSPNAAPVADSGGPYAGSVGVPVLFSSSGSVDSDGTIVAYEWTFGDGGFSTLENPTHVYAAKGTYPVTLTVTDDDGATDVATTEAVIRPFNELPVADANGPYSALLGDLVYLSGDGSVDPDGWLRSYEWDFGDGTTATGVRNTVHFYAAVGTYTAVLKVTDDRGGSDTDTATVTITPVDENPFVDDDDSIFENDIEWMATEGITKGCNPPTNDRFCPDSNVTRGQMAAFLVRALKLTQQLDNPFIDDDDSIFEADIEKLAAAGITRGCNPSEGNTKFCPDARVTRGQMAAFLVRALKYTDNGGGNLFIDDDESIFENDIDCLGTAAVTKGCNPADGNTKFCPDRNVTRGQMAAFLHRALS